jgi:hypothetical protein
MAKTVKFSGDASTGLGKFSVYESVGGYDTVNLPINESIACTVAYEATFGVPAASPDFLVDLTPTTNAKKVCLILSGPASVKFGSASAPGLALNGISVLGGGIDKLYVTAATEITVTVLAGV